MAVDAAMHSACHRHGLHKDVIHLRVEQDRTDIAADADVNVQTAARIAAALNVRVLIAAHAAAGRR